MNKIKLLIVDDEPLAHKVLEGYCKKIDDVQVVGNAYDGISTLNFLAKNDVDAILLDIQMPDLTGFELLDTLQQNAPKIIFTTAYTDYAVQGFDYDQVVDYLHKPIRITRFIKALQRLKKQLRLEQQLDKIHAVEAPKSPIEIREFISLKENKITYKINLADIKYIQSWGNYLKVFLNDGKVKMIRKTIKNMEDTLTTDNFQRIHKSYIVNMEKVTALDGNRLMLEDMPLPIGKIYQLQIKKWVAGK